jgi:hypothetical protein
MAPKRYFFVHLVIFVGLCATFAIAGLSSYREYRRAESRAMAAKEATGGPEADADRDREVPVLALSAVMNTK